MESLIGHILSTYLADYFSNFSREKFSMSLISGVISVEDLIFREDINDRINFPIKLKFGLLGKLTITINSYTNLTKGISCKIQNVFLNFDMLEMNKWSKETVIEKQQELKRFLLDQQEKNAKIVHGALEKTAEEVTSENIQKILANLKIEVENVYVRFEDETLRFSMGLLLPKVSCLSTKFNFEESDDVIEQVDEIFKKIQATDNSAFINTGKNFKSFREEIDPGKNLTQNVKKMTSAESVKLCKRVNDYIADAFEDSANRFPKDGQIPQTRNQYLFIEKPFSIDCQLRYVQNLEAIRLKEAGREFVRPNLQVDLIVGGLFQAVTEALIGDNTTPQDLSAQASVKQVLSEEQLYVTLHLVTILSAYESFSQGVTAKEFNDLSAEDIAQYEVKFQDYLKFKIETKPENQPRYSKMLDDKVQDLWQIEKKHHTHALERLRNILSQLYYSRVKEEARLERDKKYLEDEKKSGLGFLKRGISNADYQERLKQIHQSYDRQNQALENEKQIKIERLLNNNFDDQDDLGYGQDAKKDEVAQSDYFQLNLKMPKYQIEVLTKPPVQISERDSKNTLGKISFEGLRVKMETKTLPFMSKLSIFMDSLSIQDPNVQQEVKLLNSEQFKDAAKLAKISDYVLTTVQDKQSQDQEDFDRRMREVYGEDKEVEPQLFKLEILTQEMEEYKNSRSNHTPDQANNMGATPRLNTLNSARETADQAQKLSLFTQEDEINPVLNKSKQPEDSKEFHTSINFNVIGKLLIYSNFFFINKVFRLVTNIVNDMALKRKKLLASETNEEILQNVREGFNYMQKLKKLAFERMEDLRKEQLEKQRKNIQEQSSIDDEILSAQSIKVSIVSPKIIFDEYLLGQKVLDPKLPALFLLDMGSWDFETKVYQKDIEMHTEFLAIGGLKEDEPVDKNTSLRNGIYESLDMKFTQLSMHYSPDSSEVFLVKKSQLNLQAFEVFGGMNLGVQYMSLLKTEDCIPQVVINLFFDKLKLNFDRKIFCQMLKIQSFMNYGAWNEEMTKMNEALESVNDFLENQIRRKTESRLRENQIKREFKNELSERFLHEDNKQKTKIIQEGYSPFSQPGQFLETPRSISLRQDTDPTFEQAKNKISLLAAAGSQVNQDAKSEGLSTKSRTRDSVAGTGSRINLIFNKLSLAVQTVKWESPEERKAQSPPNIADFSKQLTNTFSMINTDITKMTKKLSKNLKVFSKFKAQKNFKLDVKSLKISLNQPEMDAESQSFQMMDCLVFLQRVNVKDQMHENSHFKYLLDYREQHQNRTGAAPAFFPNTGWSRTTARTTAAKNNPANNGGSSRKSRLSQRGKTVDQDNKTLLFDEPILDQKSHSHQPSQQLLDVQIKANNSSRRGQLNNKPRGSKIDFQVFDKFQAFKKYQSQKNQFSIRYKTESLTEDSHNSKDYSRKVDSLKFNDIYQALEEKAITRIQSSTQIKVGQVKIVAVYDLIERLLQMNFNTIYDLTSVDEEYKRHLDNCKIKQTPNLELKFIKEASIFSKKQPQHEDFVDENIKFDSKRESKPGNVNASFDYHKKSLTSVQLQNQITLANDQRMRRKSTMRDTISKFNTLQIEADSDGGNDIPEVIDLKQIKECLKQDAKHLSPMAKSHSRSISPMSHTATSIFSESIAMVDFESKVKLIREAWSDEMDIQAPQIEIIVPTNLMNEQARSLKVQTGISIEMLSHQEELVLYDTQMKDLTLRKIHSEIQSTDSRQNISIQSLELYLSEMVDQPKIKDNQESKILRGSRPSEKAKFTRQNLAKTQLFGQHMQKAMNQRFGTQVGMERVSQEVKNNILHKLDLEFSSDYKTVENQAIIDNLADHRDAETRKLNLMALSDKEPAYKQVAMSDMNVTLGNQLVLTIKLNDILHFQSILQLILHKNNILAKLEAEPLEEFTRLQKLAKEQNFLKSQKMSDPHKDKQKKIALAFPASASQLLPAIDNEPRQSIVSLFSVNSEGNKFDVPASNIRHKEKQSGFSKLIQQDPRLALLNFRKQDSEHSISSIDNTRRTEIQPELALDHDDLQQQQCMSVEHIAQMHTQKPLDVKDSLTVHSVNNNDDSLSQAKTLIYSVMNVQCEYGLRVSLDSDLTHDYVEYVLGIEAEKFSMKQSSLTGDDLLTNKFHADSRFSDDQKAMLALLKQEPFRNIDSRDPLPIEYNLMTYDQAIDLNFKLIYFNRKTFCMEPLIEPYRLSMTVSQVKPLDQMETYVSSKDMLDINLTYGCVISLLDTLKFIKEYEDKLEAEITQEIEEQKKNDEVPFINKLSLRTESSQLMEQIPEESQANEMRAQGARRKKSSKSVPPLRINVRVQDAANDQSKLIQVEDQSKKRRMSKTIAPLRLGKSNMIQLNDQRDKGRHSVKSLQASIDQREDEPSLSDLEMLEMRKFVKKLNIRNTTGKKLTVWLSNEQEYNTNVAMKDSVVLQDANKIELPPDQSLVFNEKHPHHVRQILKLFSSYEDKEVVKAQLYMHIRVEKSVEDLEKDKPKYKLIWNVQVYQTGMLSFKLKRTGNGGISQYIMCHTTRQDTATIVNFESIAAVYNKLKFDVYVGAWSKNKDGVMKREDQIVVEKNKVQVIPISWFENQYQIKVAHFDQTDKERLLASENIVMTNIKKVLNPNITDPCSKFDKQIEIHGNQVAFEVALLTTRNKHFGQFVMTLSYVCKFNNLMMSPIKIVPRKLKSSSLQVNGGDEDSESQEMSSRDISADSNPKLQNVFKVGGEGNVLQPDQSRAMDTMNLEKADDQMSAFTIYLFLSSQSVYSAEINFQQLSKMKANKSIGFHKGIMVDLKKVPDKDLAKLPGLTMNLNDISQNTNTDLSKTLQDLDVISVVLEKVPRKGSLKNCDYDAFKLRSKVFYHQCSYQIDVYAPLMAVNLTNHCVRIFDTEKKDGTSLTSLNLPKEKYSYLNLHPAVNPKLFMQVQGYKASQPFSFQEIGMQNVIQMKQHQENNSASSNSESEEQKQPSTTTKSSLKKIELATMITHGLAPYEKTKILRIVQRTVIINQLQKKLKIKEPQSDKETIIQEGKNDYDFLALNSKNSLAVRLFEEKEEPKNDLKSQSTSNQDYSLRKNTTMIRGGTMNRSLTQKSFSASHLELQTWSYTFHTENIGDFQITIPTSTSARDRSDVIQEDWSHSNDKLFVRVSITQDLTDEGKLIVTLSKPFQPEFFCINHTDQPLKLQQKEKDGKHNLNYEIEESFDSQLMGLPFVLNPSLPKSADVLSIWRTDNGKRYKIRIGDNKVKKLTFGDKNNKGFECQVQTRKSGSCWLVEFYGIEKKLYNKNTCDDQQKVWEERVKALSLQQKGDPKGLAKFDITKTLLMVRLGGLGISMVDYNPQEFSYFSVEGIELLQEFNSYKDDRREKTFTKIETSIRNIQLDDCLSDAIPICFGPKQPFRNIERMFRKTIPDKDKQNMPLDQKFIKAWVCMSEESDGAINTKTIEDIRVEMTETELNLQVTFLGKLQDFFDFFIQADAGTGSISSSAIMINMGIINQLLAMEEIGIDFNQTDLKKRVWEAVCERKPQEEQQLLRKATAATMQREGNIPIPEKVCAQLIIEKPNDQEMKSSVMSYNKVFVENIVIKQIKMAVNLRIRGIERVLKKRGALGFLLNFGSNFGDITGAEFIFNEMELAGLNATQDVISAQLVQHYKGEAITQFYQLATQQDILGNPGSFIKNLAKAGVEAKSAPFDALVTSDASKKGIRGCYSGLKGLAGNTTLAFSSSYSGVSGSLYLGLKNICNAKITHQDMDRPLTVKGAFVKGSKGFGVEIWHGLSGLYVVPRNRVRAQGVGAKQISKGIGQGVFQFLVTPVNATLRATYNLSTGIKNQIKGHKMSGQRFRHPRYIDNELRMSAYDPVMSHAATALRECQEGRFNSEVMSYALELTKLTDKSDRQIERVAIITNNSILLIEALKHLKKKIPLRQIRGMMVYYYNHKKDSERQFVNMELQNNKVERLHLKDAEKTQKFVKELQRQLQQLERLDKLNQEMAQIENQETKLASRNHNLLSNQSNHDNETDQLLLNSQRFMVHNIYEGFDGDTQDDEISDDESLGEQNHSKHH